ncbi:ADP-ribosylglycohydrolase family protein [Staphylospora marina]|uniref:ADP-ribosylglycohydrolase family protein n=1 Tax=Staphylospora marina TaxID=2490858 RepID=UPI000F5BC7E4|nr:ADP-ribosylglycohydrolase family protein [Staphylospora marina]
MIGAGKKREKAAGGMWGLLVADAIGVPYEFHDPSEIPALEQLEMSPPAGFRRSYPHVPPGTWSDDGAHALALLDSLLSTGEMDPEDLVERIAGWYERGDYAVDGLVFDVGLQTSRAIRAYRSGTPATEAGSVDLEAKGNGALMRVLPLALWHEGTDEELVSDAHLQALVTHGHPTNQVCSALYSLWARRLLNGMEDAEEAWFSAVEALRGLYPEDSVYREELEYAIRPDEDIEPDGSGYVVNGLRAARWALRQGSYEEVVKYAISLGDDTDTNAAIAGGLAGIRDGIGAVPENWLSALRGKELAHPLIERLLERYQ